MLICMRTTIDINDELYRDARKKAREEGIPLRELVERALRLQLKSGRRGDGAYRLSWKTERGRLRPGIDLADRRILFDLMDDRA